MKNEFFVFGLGFYKFYPKINFTEIQVEFQPISSLEINLNHIGIQNTPSVYKNQFNICCPPMEDLSDVKLIRTDTTL